MSFVELDEDEGDLEKLARRFLLDDDNSNEAFRCIATALQRQERNTSDRRGDFNGRFVLGAYCHGGQRGLTNLSRRLPCVTRFLTPIQA